MIPVITITIFVQVVLRYVFLSPVRWAEELTRYLMVWISCLGSAYAVRKAMHVNFSFIFNLLPRSVKPWVNFFGYLLTLVFFVVCLVQGALLAFSEWIQKSPALRVPMTIPLSAIPIGFGIMIMFVLESFSGEVRKVVGPGAPRSPGKGTETQTA
jgi:TRAP-type C4-dicarboxylate transport system permease small subunit